MQKRMIVGLTVLALVAVLLVACGGAAAAPANTAPNTVSRSSSAQSGSASAGSQGSSSTNSVSNAGASNSTTGLEAQSVDGGSVTVEVKPVAVAVGQPIEFQVAMNTHSVDLSNDMVASSVLEDNAGNEYKPTAWDGPPGGGHHRSGTLKFDALKTKPQSLTLIIKGIAGVADRTFKWDLP